MSMLSRDYPVKDICEMKDNPSYGHGGMWTAEGYYGKRYDDRHDDYRYGNHRELVDSLHRDLQNASSEQEREYIRNMIRKYEK